MNIDWLTRKSKFTCNNRIEDMEDMFSCLALRGTLPNVPIDPDGQALKNLSTLVECYWKLEERVSQLECVISNRSEDVYLKDGRYYAKGAADE